MGDKNTLFSRYDSSINEVTVKDTSSNLLGLDIVIMGYFAPTLIRKLQHGLKQKTS